MDERRRNLRTEEAALWRRVTATVVPLQPKLRPVTAPEPKRPEGASTTNLTGRSPHRPPQPTADRSRPRPHTYATTNRHGAPLGHGIAPGLDRRSLDRLRRGRIAYERVLDLHGRTQDEAQTALRGFLASAQAAGHRCVLVVTGKGFRMASEARGETGILKRMVPHWLNESDNRVRVLAFCHAIPPHGGEGALYVLLRRRRGRHE